LERARWAEREEEEEEEEEEEKRLGRWSTA